VYRLDTLRHSFYTELLKVQEYVVIPKEFWVIVIVY
jgi:hypothetical protein